MAAAHVDELAGQTIYLLAHVKKSSRGTTLAKPSEAEKAKQLVTIQSLQYC